MTQAISSIGFFAKQQVSALSGLTGNQTMASNRCVLAGAPNRKKVKLSDMAKTIRAGQDKNITNFKGTKEELAKYLSYQVSSGDLNIQSKPYNKTIRTADGKVYKVSISTQSEDISLILENFPGNKSACVVCKDISKGKKNKLQGRFPNDYKYGFSYNSDTFKKDSVATKEYAAMKQRFGMI